MRSLAGSAFRMSISKTPKQSVFFRPKRCGLLIIIPRDFACIILLPVYFYVCNDAVSKYSIKMVVSTANIDAVNARINPPF